MTRSKQGTPPVIRTLLCVVLIPLAACSTTHRTAGSPTACGSDRISAEDVAALGTASHTAHDVVTRLCPLWLNARGTTSILAPVDVVVYVDGTRVGGREGLHLVPASDVAAVCRMSPADAATRFGRGHGAGAVLVSTRRR